MTDQRPPEDADQPETDRAGARDDAAREPADGTGSPAIIGDGAAADNSGEADRAGDGEADALAGGAPGHEDDDGDPDGGSDEEADASFAEDDDEAVWGTPAQVGDAVDREQANALGEDDETDGDAYGSSEDDVAGSTHDDIDDGFNRDPLYALADDDDADAGFDEDSVGDDSFEQDDEEEQEDTADEARVPAATAPQGEEAAARREGERVAKVIARAGVASRRDAEVLIAEGRVSVNGVRLETPAVVVTEADEIRIDGEPIPTRLRTRAWLFHKPKGLVTTNRDPEGRPTVFDALPGTLPRVVTVGRLDINTEGLLILTNDGGLARVLELPATGWTRRYRARVHGEVDEKALAALREGTAVDGILYGPIEVTVDRKVGDNAWVTISLAEGKNREVKIVLGSLGLQVTRLIRISFGPFQLGELPRGEVKEIPTRQLKDQLGPRLAAEASADFEAPVSATVRRAPEPAAKGRPKPSGNAFRDRGDARRDGGDARGRRPGGREDRFSGGRDERRSAPRGRVIPSFTERAYRAETEEDSDWGTARREPRSFDPLARGLTPIDGPRHGDRGRDDRGRSSGGRGDRPDRAGSSDRDRRPPSRGRDESADRFSRPSSRPRPLRDEPAGEDIAARAPWDERGPNRTGATGREDRNGDRSSQSRNGRSGRDTGREGSWRETGRDMHRDRGGSGGPGRDGGRSGSYRERGRPDDRPDRDGGGPVEGGGRARGFGGGSGGEGQRRPWSRHGTPGTGAAGTGGERTGGEGRSGDGRPRSGDRPHWSRRNEGPGERSGGERSGPRERSGGDRSNDRAGSERERRFTSSGGRGSDGGFIRAPRDGGRERTGDRSGGGERSGRPFGRPEGREDRPSGGDRFRSRASEGRDRNAPRDRDAGAPSGKPRATGTDRPRFGKGAGESSGGRPPRDGAGRSFGDRPERGREGGGARSGFRNAEGSSGAGKPRFGGQGREGGRDGSSGARGERRPYADRASSRSEGGDRGSRPFGGTRGDTPRSGPRGEGSRSDGPRGPRPGAPRGAGPGGSRGGGSRGGGPSGAPRSGGPKGRPPRS
jgi:23S rRNA pseudouridine2605 synthase